MKFLVLFLVPPAVIDQWKATPLETRGPAEQKMMADWQAWTAAHAGQLTQQRAGGRTKRVSASGVADTRNEITLTAFVEAESLEAAAAMFRDHPHLGIPQATIEVMELREMGGGQG